MRVIENDLRGLVPDEAFDLVVIGAGGAGLSAALFAALDGARVLIVERTGLVGGTTAWSAGTTWVPGTHHSDAMGSGDISAMSTPPVLSGRPVPWSCR